jgi:hypothetical protein
MRRHIIDRLFVIAVFGLVYSILLFNVSFTGFSIALPFDLSEGKQQDDSPNIFIDIGEKANTEIKGISEGENILVRDGINTYQVTFAHVVQDFQQGQEYASLLEGPGDKRLRLPEGGRALVDFNNDGHVEVMISVSSISSGMAAITVQTR